MSTNITPRLGKCVLYTLSEADAKQIIQDRRNAGIAAARGNDPHEGDTYPAIIVRDFGSTAEQVAAAHDSSVVMIRSQWRAANGKAREEDRGLPGWPVEFVGMSEDDLQQWIAARGEEFSRVWNPENAAVNLQVFLDGTDVYWATSRTRAQDDEKDSRKGRWFEPASS